MLADLGEAPPQVPRAENYNVELLLKNASGKDERALKPDQLYSETKYLLFTVLRSMPAIETESDDMRSVLREIHQYAMKTKEGDLTEKIKRIISNCNQLVDESMLQVDDNYAQLRKDTYEEVINYESRISQLEEQCKKLQDVLNAIHQHNDFLQGQYEAYQEYLDNVRKSSEVEDQGKKGKKKEKKKSAKAQKGATNQKRGPFKFSHVQLQRDGVILESGVPEERRSNIFFEFTSESPGIYDVRVLYRSKGISSVRSSSTALSPSFSAFPPVFSTLALLPVFLLLF